MDHGVVLTELFCNLVIALKSIDDNNIKNKIIKRIASELLVKVFVHGSSAT